MKTFILVLVMAQAAGTQLGAPEVTTKNVKSRVGQEAVACGAVIMYSCDDDKGVLELFLDTPSSRPGIAIAVPRAHWPDSRGRELTDKAVGARVCARGLVQKTSQHYFVVVQAKDRIELPAGPALGPPLAPEAIHTCAEGVKAPLPLRQVKPGYTRDAMRALQEGVIYLEAIVRSDGTVGDVRPLLTLEPEHGLTAQAIAAFKQWRFRPATLGGVPVPVVTTVELTFTVR